MRSERSAWLFAPIWLAVSCCLAGCIGSLFGTTPETRYPDQAWAAGVQGDVTVERCPGSSSKVIESRAADLTSEALRTSTTWPSPTACERTRFAFRRSPSQSDVMELTGQKGTILVTRGFESASRLNCPSWEPFSQAAFRSGNSVAVLTIDRSGRVVGVFFRQSVGGVNEARWADQLRACAFSPATLDGRAVASHYVSAVEWGPGP